MPKKIRSSRKSWKDIQSKTRTKKKIRLGVIVLLLIAGLLVISLAVRFTQTLFNTSRSYTWDGEFNINLVVRSKNISLLSYNPKEASVTIVDLPDETFVDVPSGFGLWQLRAVYGLGGDKLLTETLRTFLAMPIDGFLDLEKGSASEIVNTLRQNPFSGFNLLSGLKTDLTMWELINLKLKLLDVRFDKINELDLDDPDILIKESLPDGTQVLKSDPVKLDSVLSSLTADPAIVSERKSIAVLNATGRPQLANKWARLITNLGGNVIITTNAQRKLKKTQIVGEQSQTLKRLQQIFASGDKINPSDQDLVYPRAQINVLLGEDFADR